MIAAQGLRWVSDRRDQARRDGHHELAVRGYAARARVHTGADLTRAEDAALDAAHTDAQHGRTTIVLAQTSNDHLEAVARTEDRSSPKLRAFGVFCPKIVFESLEVIR